MADGASTSADTADAVEQQITFNVKASSNQTYALTFAVSSTVKDVKEKLATPEYADIPADRIRLIYSGRVLKDPDTLASCKPEIKDGYTIHMVKGADSNSRQNPASGDSSAPAAPAVPSNIAAGTGNNALAGLTGARYAGFHGLPNASMFGADGGMGPPPGPEAMLRQMEDPNFLQQMNEAMNNPAVIEMIENHPMMRDNPMMRQMIRDPAMRRMMMDPNMIRMQMQMQQQMGGEDGGSAFPAPGVTDTTPQAGNTGASAPPAQPAQPGQSNPPPNPFAGGLLGGWPGLGAAAGAGTTPATSPPPAASAGGGIPSMNSDPNQQNPFARLFGAPPTAGGEPADNPLAQMTQQMMQNPEMMRSAMQMMGGGMNPGAAPGAGVAAGGGGAAAANPFASLFNNQYGSLFQPPAAQSPPDNRPPEERYEAQLRQLNDMGFYEFERNVQALRRSGGSVQGAIEFLLGGGG